MATQTTLELVEYYAKLLILQYVGKPKAYAQVQATAGAFILPQTSTQQILFSAAATTGTYVLAYGDELSAAINWDDSLDDIQNKIRAVPGLSDVTVTASVGLSYLVTFINVAPPATLLVVQSNSLSDGSDPVALTITETDLILPLAIQNAFNLLGEDTAQGVQLDTIGKYAGVSRTGAGFNSQITLNDADFLSLIRMAIIKNSSGSSLAEIAGLVYQFFGTQMLVFDYKNMRMSYYISEDVGSNELIQLFVTEGILPVPMAVLATVIYAPVVTVFFGFRTYLAPAVDGTPFNTYTDYNTSWKWLSYKQAIII